MGATWVPGNVCSVVTMATNISHVFVTLVRESRDIQSIQNRKGEKEIEGIEETERQREYVYLFHAMNIFTLCKVIQ